MGAIEQQQQAGQTGSSEYKAGQIATDVFIGVGVGCAAVLALLFIRSLFRGGGRGGDRRGRTKMAEVMPRGGGAGRAGGIDVPSTVSTEEAVEIM